MVTLKLYVRRANVRFGQCQALAAVLILLALSLPAVTQVSVTTHHNDNARTGQNLDETLLTLANVNTKQFGELFSQPVDGIVVGQPLYLPNLLINGAIHNVVFVTTLHDSVYAFDADSNTGSNAAALWHTVFIDIANGTTTAPIQLQGCAYTGFNEVGIVGTPVIDPTTGTLYVVAKTLENGVYVHRLHALDVATGRAKFGGPVVIYASVTINGKKITFADRHHMQRPALLLSNGLIYIAFGTMGCKSYPPSTGWLMAYEASNLKQMSVLDVAPAEEALPGIWMAGDGPAADSNGDVYVATGDGAFDYSTGGLDYGDTLFKLTLGNGAFTLGDYFTPYNQAELYSEDLDLGSSGPVLLPDQSSKTPHLAVIAGKQGMIYLINRDNMGQYDPVIDQVVQEEPFEPNVEAEIDGGATYWNDRVYFGGWGYHVKSFSLTNGVLSSEPVAKSSSTHHTSSLFSISANGTKNGILWGLERNNGSSALDAFNATNLDLLYSSSQNPGRDPIGETSHFVLPTIANGKVYVGTTNSLVVTGLLP